jgi:predicted TIM-barrel fold metal-dependent hydrolase
MKTCQPPVANSRKPRYQAPPGACDAHCHVFGPADKFPYAPDRSYTPPDAGKERLRALHDHLGIERGVIVHASCHGTDNQVTLDAIATSGGRYKGVAVVGGEITDKEIEALDRGGICGVRFNFVAHLGGTPDLQVFDRILGRIEPLGWHVVLHLDAQDIPVHAERINRIRMPFIIDHMGRVQAKNGLDQKPFRTLLELMGNPNAWVKICGPERVSSSGPPFRDAIPFARALVEAAPDRVLWGTDFPHPNIAGTMPDDGNLVDLFAEIVTDDGLRRRILVDNPARLYRFGDRSPEG